MAVQGIRGIVEAAISRASQATGVNFSFLMKTANRESGMNPRAQASSSSAAGLFQFVEQTWLSTLKQHGAAHGYARYADLISKGSDGRYHVEGAEAKRAVMDLRLDPHAAAMMAGELTADSAAYLKGRTGRDPTAGELYAAHFLGPQGSAKLIEAAERQPGASAAHLFPAEAHANKAIFYHGGQPATVGQVLPNMEVKIVDPETGRDLPPDTQGEIVARGFNIMKGYYKMPEATGQAIDADGWLHTGDLGLMDEAGYFKITGRLKDMIIRGGENIYPREIEEFLYTHPAVKDVQVVGLPDKVYGEEICAFVILKEGETLTAGELQTYTRERLSRHKTPRYVEFVEEFPMTASGKIQKFKLREMGIERLSLEEAAAVETA